jgi:hypothetical protein
MITLLALIGMATSAQAASFRKGWDPTFNDDFSALVGIDVGWRGEALIFVADACVVPSTTQTFPACGAANLESYELTFYEVGNESNVLGQASDMFPGIPPFPDVSAISFDGSGIADGISLAGPILAPGGFTFGDYNGSFRAELSFLLNEDEGVNGPSLRLIEYCEEGQTTPCSSPYDNDGGKYPPTVVWSQVPAPASLALMGVGLCALGMMRRRMA